MMLRMAVLLVALISLNACERTEYLNQYECITFQNAAEEKSSIDLARCNTDATYYEQLLDYYVSNTAPTTWLEVNSEIEEVNAWFATSAQAPNSFLDQPPHGTVVSSAYQGPSEYGVVGFIDASQTGDLPEPILLSSGNWPHGPKLSEFWLLEVDRLPPYLLPKLNWCMPPHLCETKLGIIVHGDLPIVREASISWMHITPPSEEEVRNGLIESFPFCLRTRGFGSKGELVCTSFPLTGSEPP